jgi:uncharacterized protein YgiM (DUF1202 family)
VAWHLQFALTDRTSMLLRALPVLALVAAAGCAVGPAAVQRMDSARIQQISDYRLCDAAAVSLDLQGRRYPVIDSEIARRRVSCDEHIAAVVSDCSALQVLSWGVDQTGQGIIFTVRNGSDHAKNFRVRREERQSRLFAIGPGETTRFGITDPGVAELGDPVETNEGDGGIELLECRPVVGAWHINYHPQAPSSQGTGGAYQAPPRAHPTEPRMTRQATRSVNVRAGPGTNYAVVRTLRAGQEVAVSRITGTWCELIIAGVEHAYVTCSFLSAASSERDARGGQIRLTPIRSQAGGSNCSLYLDSGLRTLVGEWEYGDANWTVGLNGRSYRLQVGPDSEPMTRMATANGSISITINRGSTLRASNDPVLPSRVSRVTVNVTMNSHTSSISAYQSCGEG